MRGKEGIGDRRRYIEVIRPSSLHVTDIQLAQGTDFDQAAMELVNGSCDDGTLLLKSSMRTLAEFQSKKIVQ